MNKKIRKFISLIALFLFLFTNLLYAAPALRVPLIFNPKPEDSEEVQKLMAYIAGEEMPDLEKDHFGDSLGLTVSMIKDFAEKEIEKDHKVREWENDQDPTKSLKLMLRKLAELGVLGLSVPDGYGDYAGGLSNYHAYRMIERLSQAWASLGVTIAVNLSDQRAINRFGTDEQKKKYLPLLVSIKEGVGAFAISETKAGSSVWDMETTARREGEEYVLNGTKKFITSAGMARVYIVFALTDDGEGSGEKKFSAFLVDKDAPGLKVGKPEGKLGQKGSRTCELILGDCKIPAKNLLGELHGAREVFFYTINGGRLGIASLALGIAKAAYKEASDHADKREQPEDTPIIKHKEIKDMLRDMKFLIDASEIIIRYASYLEDQNSDDPTDKKVIGAVTSMAKLFATESAVWVARDAMQILGGDGYTKDRDVERLLRDVMVTTTYEGTSQIQKNVIKNRAALSSFLDPKTPMEKAISRNLETPPDIPGHKQRIRTIYRAMAAAEKELRKAMQGKKTIYRDAELLVPLTITRLMLFKAIFLANQDNVSEAIVANGFKNAVKNAVLASRLLHDSLAKYRNSASTELLLEGLDSARRHSNIRLKSNNNKVKSYKELSHETLTPEAREIIKEIKEIRKSYFATKPEDADPSIWNTSYYSRKEDVKIRNYEHPLGKFLPRLKGLSLKERLYIIDKYILSNIYGNTSDWYHFCIWNQVRTGFFWKHPIKKFLEGADKVDRKAMMDSMFSILKKVEPPYWWVPEQDMWEYLIKYQKRNDFYLEIEIKKWIISRLKAGKNPEWVEHLAFGRWYKPAYDFAWGILDQEYTRGELKTLAMKTYKFYNNLLITSLKNALKKKEKGINRSL